MEIARFSNTDCQFTVHSKERKINGNLHSPVKTSVTAYLRRESTVTLHLPFTLAEHFSIRLSTHPCAPPPFPDMVYIPPLSHTRPPPPSSSSRRGAVPSICRTARADEARRRAPQALCAGLRLSKRRNVCCDGTAGESSRGPAASVFSVERVRPTHNARRF